MESLKTEVSSLSNKMKKIKMQINEKTNDAFFKSMQKFLKSAEQEVKSLEDAIQVELEDVRIELAKFLCEDINSFKFEECFHIFYCFCQRFKLAVEENQRQRENELKLEARRRTSKNNHQNNVAMRSTNSYTEHMDRPRPQSLDSIDDELDSGLMEFLRTANEANVDGSLFGSSLRRSGRRSRSYRDSRDSSDFDSRERHPSAEHKDTSLSRTGSLRRRSLNRDTIRAIEVDDIMSNCGDTMVDTFSRAHPARRTYNCHRNLSAPARAVAANAVDSEYRQATSSASSSESSQDIKQYAIRSEPKKDSNLAIVMPQGKFEQTDDNNNCETTVNENVAFRRKFLSNPSAVVAPLNFAQRLDFTAKQIKSPIQELIAITSSINKSLAKQKPTVTRNSDVVARSRLPVRVHQLTSVPQKRAPGRSVSPLQSLPVIVTPAASMPSRAKSASQSSALRYQTPLPKTSLVMKTSSRNAYSPQANFRRASITASKKAPPPMPLFSSSPNGSLNSSGSRSSKRSNTSYRSGPSFMKQTSASAAKSLRK